MRTFASEKMLQVDMHLMRIILPMSMALMAMAAQADERDSQDTDRMAIDTSKVVDIDEVVVVSQPKENFNLRKQPLGSSMFGANDLRRICMRDLRDLSLYAPSLTMPSYGSRYTSAVYIRGIGSRINSPAVAIYSDGLPLMNKTAYNTHSYQLARVDVLRGPQGTLYGINSEGGMIRMYSLNPMQYQGTQARVGVGSHFTRYAEIGHYARLDDRHAFSIAGFYNGQNGFLTNVTTHERADKMNEAGGKLHWIYAPTSDMKIDYLLDYQYVRQNGFAYGVWTPETGHTEAPAANRQPNYRRNMLNTGLIFTRRWASATFSSTTSYQYLKDYMLMDIDYLPADYLQMSERQHQNALTHEMAIKGMTAIGNRPTAWRWTAGSFTAYQWNKTEAPVTFFADMNQMLASTIQQSMHTDMVLSMAARYQASGMNREQAVQAAERLIASRGGVAVDVEMGTIPGQFHLPVFNQGVFHESTIDLSHRISLTLGLRYDLSLVRLGYHTQAQMTTHATVMGSEATSRLTSTLTNSYHDHYSQLLPKVGLTYKLNQQGDNLYAVMSKGYRSGGFNYQIFSDILQAELRANSSQRGDYDIPHTADDYARIKNQLSYAPETTWNYEIGAHLGLFANTIQLDAAAYLMNVSNLQLSVMAGQYGLGRMMVNAGRSRSMGGELSLRGSHLDNRLTWTATYALTHSVFRDYQDSQTTDGIQHTIDYRHRRVPYIPHHTLAASADYRLPLGAGTSRSLTIGANATAQGSTYWDEANSYCQPMYVLLGAHADVATTHVTVSLWGRNLTNTRYNTFAVESQTSGRNMVFAQQGTPLQVGLDLRFHF